MAKTKEELVSMIENDLVDPSTNKITGERVKNALTEMVDAMGTGGGGAMEYWSVPEELSEDAAMLAMLAPWVKCQMNDIIYIAGSAVAGMTLVAFAVDPAANLFLDGQSYTFYEFLPQMGISSLADLGYVQITKEEFYTIS